MKLLQIWLAAVMTVVSGLMPAVDSEGAEAVNSSTPLKVLFVSAFQGNEAQEIKKPLESLDCCTIRLGSAGRYRVPCGQRFAGAGHPRRIW